MARTVLISMLVARHMLYAEVRPISGHERRFSQLCGPENLLQTTATCVSARLHPCVIHACMTEFISKVIC